MTEQTSTEKPEQENPFLKLLLEIGPLAIFFFAYSRGEALASWAGFPDTKPLFAATAVFIPTMGLSLIASWFIQRKIPIMPLVSFVLVAVMGGLTLYLQNDTFIKMKPTILNLLFAAVLAGGLAYGKLFLKVLFEGGFSITDEGWRVLTLRWMGFFIVMAILNELIWRNFSEEFWVGFKVWGNLPITLIFGGLQLLVVQKYALPEDE